MKPTKIRNLQLYRAPRNILSKQLGSNLSKDLRQKYGKRSIRVTVGDTVKVVRGEYKGIDGKVKEVDTLKNAVTIEGIKKEKLKGGQFDVYIHSTNLLVTELNTNDKWRIQKLEGTKISKQKETKPKEQEEVKQKEVKEEEKQKEPKETELTPKQELKAKPTPKKPKEPKAKPAPKKAKKESKEKKDEK